MAAVAVQIYRMVAGLFASGTGHFVAGERLATVSSGIEDRQPLIERLDIGFGKPERRLTYRFRLGRIFSISSRVFVSGRSLGSSGAGAGLSRTSRGGLSLGSGRVGFCFSIGNLPLRARSGPHWPRRVQSRRSCRFDGTLPPTIRSLP